MIASARGRTVVTLGTAQTLAWASSYYLPAILAAPMAHDLGVSTPTIFAAFSLALIVSAVLGPWAGRNIDRWGGRSVLTGTSLVFAAGLAALASARGPVGLFAAWVVLGIGMGSGLYEAAFAALVRVFGREARGSITGITLIAGFASTISWPLTAWLEIRFGWRGACWTWAALHLLIGLPLNASLPHRHIVATPVDSASAGELAAGTPAAGRAAALLAFVFAVTWFVSTAMAAHLPALLQAGGATLAAAVAVGALVGPAQVAGRLLEFGLLRRVHPLWSARVAALMHPVGACVFLSVGAPAGAAFALLHGAGNGILTIAKGTLPLVLFGPAGYGHRQGWLMVPARLAQALAPWMFGLWLDRFGADALRLSAILGGTVLVALMLLPPARSRLSR
ncbi:MAG: MFS transporter [Burkholderiales bacterium]|nr:MFS transporter [Burkholderiales bacterium]